MDRPLTSPAELAGTALGPLGDLQRVYRCGDCGAVLRLGHDHYLGVWVAEPLPRGVADLLPVGPATLEKLLALLGDAAAAKVPGVLVDRAREAAGERAVPLLLAATEHRDLGFESAAALLRWLVEAVRAGVEAWLPPPASLSELARLGSDGLMERLESALERGARRPPGPPVGEVDRHRAAVCLESLGPALSLATHEPLFEGAAAAGRVWRRLALLQPLHGLLEIGHAPATRHALWMPDADWLALYELAGREGRRARVLAALARLACQRELDADAVREQLMLLEPLIGRGFPLPGDAPPLLAELADRLAALPVERSFDDPVAEARALLRRLGPAVRGEGPARPVVDP